MESSGNEDMIQKVCIMRTQAMNFRIVVVKSFAVENSILLSQYNVCFFLANDHYFFYFDGFSIEFASCAIRSWNPTIRKTEASDRLVKLN